MRAGRPGMAWRRLTAVALGCGLLLAGCAEEPLPQDVLQPAGPVARQQDALWNLVFPIAVVVFVLVQGALLYCVWRYRRRGDDDELPKQVAGNTRLEVIWTIIPAVLLAVVAVPTVGTIFDLARPPGEDALDVRVVAKQYWWEFEYLGEEGQGVVTANELHIPIGRPVHLRMESKSAIAPDPGIGEPGAPPGPADNGVIHSFWVPRLAGKQDVVPGHVRNLTIVADEPGSYSGQCAEMCGLSHARMRFEVVAQTRDEFQQWLDEQAEPAVDEFDSEQAARGQELFEEATCIACHTIDGYQASGGGEAVVRVGPDLTHFASRGRFAGGTIPINEENLTAWLENPQALKPGAQMPDLPLEEGQIDALVAYLLSLE